MNPEDQILEIADTARTADFDFDLGDDHREIRIAGYGRIYWDDQCDGGLVVEYEGYGDPVELDDIIDELKELA